MIYTVGETVLDIIIKTFDNVNIKVGGSMLNTAISLGRLGMPISHVSYLSDDQVADEIVRFLSDNNVLIEFLKKNQNIQTNLALAFLDEDKKANYTFYKNKELKGLDFSFPIVKRGDVILFGSFFSLNADFRIELVSFLNQAKRNGALLIYDPNFRKPHLSQLEQVKSFVEENLSLADIVKASDEDFQLIFGAEDARTAWDVANQFNVEYLIYTEGDKGASLWCESMNVFVPSNRIEPVSTIGAGDTFSAGIIYSLLKDNNVMKNESSVRDMLNLSHQFSSQVCLSMDNYLSKEFISKKAYVQ